MTFQILPHFTAKEVADLCMVSLRTVEGWRYRDQGPPFIRLENGQIRYLARETLAFAGYDVTLWNKSMKSKKKQHEPK